MPLSLSLAPLCSTFDLTLKVQHVTPCPNTVHDPRLCGAGCLNPVVYTTPSVLLPHLHSISS